MYVFSDKKVLSFKIWKKSDLLFGSQQQQNINQTKQSNTVILYLIKSLEKYDY